MATLVWRVSLLAIGILTALVFFRSELSSLDSLRYGVSRLGSASQASEPSLLRRRVVAVADLHGDLEHAHNVLRMAKLIRIDARGEPQWIGGDDVLVSTGDIVDRGDDTIALYHLFDDLRVQASRQGGAVLNVMGNHEMMNSMHDWRYVTKGDLASFGGAAKRRAVMSESGWIGQTWLQNYNVTRVVPLLNPGSMPISLLATGYRPPSASFTHGGILPTWAKRGVDGINALGHSLLLKSLSDRGLDGGAAMRLPSGISSDELALWSEGGPLWCRNYSTQDEDEACESARQTMDLLGVERLVMGHTPNLDGFVVRCGGSLVVIDTGISRAYGGEQSALILETELRRLEPSPSSSSSTPPRSSRDSPAAGGLADGASVRWQERKTMVALYKGRKPRLLDESTRIVGR